MVLRSRLRLVGGLVAACLVLLTACGGGGGSSSAGGQGDAAGAARTLGAVDAISRAQGQAVEPVLQRLHRRLLDETRAALGDAAFDAAFAEGGRLSLEEAVAREVPNAP